MVPTWVRYLLEDENVARADLGLGERLFRADLLHLLRTDLFPDLARTRAENTHTPTRIRSSVACLWFPPWMLERAAYLEGRLGGQAKELDDAVHNV